MVEAIDVGGPMSMVVASELAYTGVLCIALLGAGVARRARNRPGQLPNLIGILLMGVLAPAAIVGGVYAFAVSHPARPATVNGSATTGGLTARTSPVGSFTDSVRITVPEFHGIEPHISLDYDSAAGNGEVGLGWRLTVGSSIVRSGPNGAQPRYDTTDVYLVDGQELVPCAPHCPTGGTHETRQQSFERFVFDGSTWSRWSRDGVKFGYAPDGLTTDTYRWSLAQVTDTHGNIVHFAEDCPSHCLPKLITYAVGPAAKSGAAIRFHYDSRPDIVPYPTGRTTRQIRHRLRTIEVRMDGQLVSAYALGYDISPSTGNSVLRSVQQYPGDAVVSAVGAVTAGPTTPYPPITFGTRSTDLPDPQWTAGAVAGPFATPGPHPDHAAYPAIATSVPGDVLHVNVDGEDLGTRQSPLYGDFDGDHRIDAASWRTGWGCPPVHVRLATQAQGNLATTLHAGCAADGYVLDLNGDAVDDILLMATNGGVSQLISRRDGTFTPQPTTVTEPWGGPNVRRRCATGDFDGDDLGDLACVYKKTNVPPRLGIVRSTPDGGMMPYDVAPQTSIANVEDVLLVTGDVDHSTTTDAMLVVAPRGGPIRLVTGFTAGNGSIASWSDTTTGWNAGPDGAAGWTAAGADVDGDARTDYLVIGANDVRIALSQKAVTAQGPQDRVVPHPVITSTGPNVAIGDGDGDGRADLLTADPAGILRSNGDGTFAVRQPFAPGGTPSCITDTSADAVAVAADSNGDGQADLLCSRHRTGGTPTFELWAQPSPVARAPLHRWTTFDRNGDGRQDFYTALYRNPGYAVYTVVARADGGFDAEPPVEVLPQAGGASLSNPDPGSWLAMDVGGGPQDAPDGRSDLVHLGEVGGTLQVTTLLSKGSGWTRPCDNACLTGANPPHGGDLTLWRPAQLDDDNRGDLVHFRPLAVGVAVEYLVSQGNGKWTAGHRDHFTSATAADGGPLTRHDVTTFRTVDLNGDQYADFTHVEVGGGPSSRYRVIRSLISTGPTTWREEQLRRYEQLDPAAAHDLQAMDFNGDRVSDLGRPVVLNGCIGVQAFIRQGETWSTAQTAVAANSCAPAAGLTDQGNLVLTDVNGDGRTDVRHQARVVTATNQTTTAMLTLLNPGDWAKPWRPVNQSELAITEPDSWAWIGVDSDSDGVGELAHVNAGGLTTLRWSAADDRITNIDNGLGATTTIAYRAQPGERAYLPAGMLPIVVDRITVSDAAYSPVVKGTATFKYENAQWSSRQRQLAGYAAVRSNDGTTVQVTGYDLGDTCGVRPKSGSTEKAVGGVLGSTSTEFDPTGASAPFTCRTAATVDSECELGTCRDKRTSYAYDRYGNIKTVEESGDAGRRQTYTPVHPNTRRYIVNRPYKRELRVPAPGSAWVVVAQTRYGYDNDTWRHPPRMRGDLTSVTDITDLSSGSASETIHHYDGAGNLIWTRNPSGVESSTNYDPDRSLFPISQCDAVSCTATTWDEARGIPTAVTDANLQTTYAGHDTYGRPTTTTRPDGSATTTRYLNTGTVTGPDSGRQRVRTEYTDGSAGDGVHWHEDLVDGLGRVYRTLDEGAPHVIITDTRYTDASDRHAGTSLPHTVAEPARWTTYEYDAAHRPKLVTHADGSSTTREYRVGAIEDRDELDHLLTSHHDSFGRIVRVDEHVRPCSDCDPEVESTAYTYDMADRLRTITDAAGLVTTIGRDSAGRDTSLTDPDRGTRTRTWRADGRLESETDANGVHAWTYDAAGRSTSRTDTGSTGSHKARWDYDVDPATGQPQGYSTGLPTVVTYSSSGGGSAVSGTDRFWYGVLGRIIRDRRCVDTECQDMGYAYDAAGRLEYLTYPVPGNPDGELVKHTYDASGRLRSVGGYAVDMAYDAAGQPTNLRYGNGLYEQRAYDLDRGWLDSQTLAKTPKPVTPLFAATYGHDLSARLTDATTKNPTPGGAASITESFTYDDLGRLATYRTSERPSLLPETYRYDAVGRITRSPIGGAHNYDDPAHPHAVTSTGAGHTRGYDAAGNLRTLSDPSGRGLKIDWTPTGMPRTIADNTGSATMAYDADGQRVRRTTVSDTTYYFGRYLEQDGAGLIRHYWAGDRLIATRGPTGTVSYLTQDRLGSTRIVTDQAGSATARYNYEPYGAQKSGNQPDGTNHLWKGQREEPDSRLVYLNARFYDPELGDFTTADNVIPDAYRPQSLNPYGMSERDPVNRVDPSGNMSMRIERKKEPAGFGSFSGMYARSFSHLCGPLADCITNNSGNTIQQTYWVTSSGKIVGRTGTTYSGGLGPDGNWDGSSVTDVSLGDVVLSDHLSAPPLLSADEPAGSDPSEWAQWPGTAEPAGSDPSEWAEWQGATPSAAVEPPSEPATGTTKAKKAGSKKWPGKQLVSAKDTEAQLQADVRAMHPKIPVFYDIMEMKKFDSSFWGDKRIFNFRGREMRSWEVNYYFVSMAMAHQGYSWDMAQGMILLWNSAQSTGLEKGGGEMTNEMWFAARQAFDDEIRRHKPH
jgi:RHS repeat-associated protein